MKSRERNDDKELYKQLRTLSCRQLWEEEVAQFNRGGPEERIKRVAVIRAIGVVFSESGTIEQKNAARLWLRELLHDPSEKLRRYAMAALPKIGADPSDEAQLLSLLRTTTLEREKKFLGQTLEKIGGAATLKEMGQGTVGLLAKTEQKLKATLAQTESPSSIRMDRALSVFGGLRIHLRGRRGLEEIVRAEAQEYIRIHRNFRIEDVRSGLVALIPIAPFTLDGIFQLRCFDTVGFAMGRANSLIALAPVIASLHSRRIFETFTQGAIRYRLDFVSKGHQRGAVRQLADRVYALCPEILNSAQNAPWTVAIYSKGRENMVELTPRLTSDPRFYFRQQDVPAASHPPLAACMARLAGRVENDVVWDPFCGSGSELIERALLGGVRNIYGTDRSADAIGITKKNFAAARLKSILPNLICCDFRDFLKIEGLGSDCATLIITNPPLGKRVHIPNLQGLIQDLFSVAATVLKPGGRLVFANPLRMESPFRSLKLCSRTTVDFGGFDCRLEKYIKIAPSAAR